MGKGDRSPRAYPLSIQQTLGLGLFTQVLWELKGLR